MQLRWEPVADRTENRGVRRGVSVELVRCAEEIVGLGHVYAADRQPTAAMCH